MERCLSNCSFRSTYVKFVYPIENTNEIRRLHPRPQACLSHRQEQTCTVDENSLLLVIDNNNMRIRAKVKWQDNKNAGFYAGLTVEILAVLKLSPSPAKLKLTRPIGVELPFLYRVPGADKISGALTDHGDFQSRRIQVAADSEAGGTGFGPGRKQLGRYASYGPQFRRWRQYCANRLETRQANHFSREYLQGMRSGRKRGEGLRRR